jgi:hypothetical protein
VAITVRTLNGTLGGGRMANMKNAGVNNEREYDFKVEDIISLNDCPP